MDNTTGEAYIKTWILNPISGGAIGGVANPMTSNLDGGGFSIKNISAGSEPSDAVCLSQITSIQNAFNGFNVAGETATSITLNTIVNSQGVSIPSFGAVTPQPTSVINYGDVETLINNSVIEPLGITQSETQSYINSVTGIYANSYLKTPTLYVTNLTGLKTNPKSYHQLIDNSSSGFNLIETFADTGLTLLTNSAIRNFSLGANNKPQLSFNFNNTISINSPLLLNNSSITGLQMNTTPALTDVANVGFVNQQIANTVLTGSATFIYNSALLNHYFTNVNPNAFTSHWIFNTTLSSPSIVMTGNNWRHRFKGLYQFNNGDNSPGVSLSLVVMDSTSSVIASYDIITTTQTNNQAIFFDVNNVIIPAGFSAPLSVRIGINLPSGVTSFNGAISCEWEQVLTSSPTTGFGVSNAPLGIDYAVNVGGPIPLPG